MFDTRGNENCAAGIEAINRQRLYKCRRDTKDISTDVASVRDQQNTALHGEFTKHARKSKIGEEYGAISNDCDSRLQC